MNAEPGLPPASSLGPTLSELCLPSRLGRRRRSPGQGDPRPECNLGSGAGPARLTAPRRAARAQPPASPRAPSSAAATCSVSTAPKRRSRDTIRPYSARSSRPPRTLPQKYSARRPGWPGWPGSPRSPAPDTAAAIPPPPPPLLSPRQGAPARGHVTRPAQDSALGPRRLLLRAGGELGARR